uniref:Uncharacterized protein n=1 Tax=Octopus bimaculoides TaxID=37653 RepID=A0A0L8HQ07_OCTBM
MLIVVLAVGDGGGRCGIGSGTNRNGSNVAALVILVAISNNSYVVRRLYEGATKESKREIERESVRKRKKERAILREEQREEKERESYIERGTMKEKRKKRLRVWQTIINGRREGAMKRKLDRKGNRERVNE